MSKGLRCVTSLTTGQALQVSYIRGHDGWSVLRLTVQNEKDGGENTAKHNPAYTAIYNGHIRRSQ